MKIGLCKGRHEIPGVELYVFPKEIPTELLLDPDGLEKAAMVSLMMQDIELGEQVDLYATGLSVALLATLNALKGMGVACTVYHYNRDNGEYYPQSLRW